MLDVKFFNKQKLIVLKKYKDHIFIDAKDVKGTPFKGYSTKGSKWVTMKVKKEFRNNAPEEGYSYKQAKEGNMFKRQDSKFSGSKAPVLTGDLLGDLNIIGSATSKGFKMGWNVWGAKVKWLEDMGRVLTSKEKAIPTSVATYLQVQGDRYINKRLGKNKTTRHKVGK